MFSIDRENGNAPVSGHFEFDVGSNVKNRVIVGHWNFGPGIFSAGQDYTPVNLFYSNRVFGMDEAFFTGEPNTGRNPMLQIAMGGAKFALVPASGNRLSDYYDGDSPWLWRERNLDSKYPRIEVSFGHSFGLISFDLVGGYQQAEYRIDDTSYSAAAWLMGGGLWVKPGPFRIGFVGFYGLNPYSLGQRLEKQFEYQMLTGGAVTYQRAGSAVFDSGEARVYDTKAWSATSILGYRLSDILNLEAGFTFLDTDFGDYYLFDSLSETWHSYYIQSAITIAPGVLVIPEYGVFNYKEEQPIYNFDRSQKFEYLVVKCQINF